MQRKRRKQTAPKIGIVAQALIRRGEPFVLVTPSRFILGHIKADRMYTWFWSLGVMIEHGRNLAISVRQEDGRWWNRKDRGKWIRFDNTNEPCDFETMLTEAIARLVSDEVLGVTLGEEGGTEQGLH
jgi:hypothetical protein